MAEKEKKEETKKNTKITVEVGTIPVRYDGKDYEPGDKVEIEEKYFNEEYFTKAEKE